jgi:2'-5' RNA ligase
MRLFVGIELSEGLRGAAAEALATVREAVGRDAPQAVVRWVDPAQLHITVWFLGDVRDRQLDRVLASCDKPLSPICFQLRVGGAGAFPPSGPPRALWLGLVDGRESLVAIHDELSGRFAPLGFEPERRAYNPHVTIGRVKEIARADVPAIRRALECVPPDLGACTIEHATLFRSHTNQRGAQYEVVRRIRLS